MALEVCGHRVLVKPDPVSEVDEKTGIIVATPETLKLEKNAVTKGELVKVGPNAWLAFDDGKPWAKVGDRVYFAKYAGKRVEDPEDPETDYLILSDEDILAVIIGETSKDE